MYGTGGRAERVSDNDMRRRVRDLIDRRMRGDINGMARHFFEGVELNYNCAKYGLFPAGQWRGRDALRENLRRTDINYEPLDYEIQCLLVDGDRSAVRWQTEWRERATGRRYEMDMAHFLRWRNGQIIEMDEIFDHRCVSRAIDLIPESLEDMISPRGPGLARDEIVEQLTRMGNFSTQGPDVSLFREICAPDVVCEFVGDRATISYAGRHLGIEALVDIIRRIGVDFEQLGHAKPDLVLVDGEHAAQRRSVEWRHRGTGRRGLVELADFVRYRDGKIVELVEFRDSLALLQMQD